MWRNSFLQLWIRGIAFSEILFNIITNSEVPEISCLQCFYCISFYLFWRVYCSFSLCTFKMIVCSLSFKFIMRRFSSFAVDRTIISHQFENTSNTVWLIFSAIRAHEFRLFDIYVYFGETVNCGRSRHFEIVFLEIFISGVSNALPNLSSY